MLQQNVIKDDITKIDSHQHFWLLARGDYSWLTPELTQLYHDYLPEHLAQALVSTNVNKTIVVQASDTEAETAFLLDLAEKTDFIAGVVGWVDMQSPNVLATLTRFSQNSYFKGIRPMLQDIDEVDWILQDKFAPVFDYLMANHLSFDALVREHQLSNIQVLARKYPALNIVINHCAKPHIDNKPSVYWSQQIEAFKTLENVFIKLSGVVTEASKGQVRVAQLTPYFETIMSVFGSNRIMWGSDWPVLKLNGDYEMWVNLTHSLLAQCSLEEQQNIWANTAQNFYKLSTQRSII